MASVIKRTFDVVIAGAALVLLTPFLLLIAMLARVLVGAAPMFRQQRTGRHGIPFTIYKFRTMRDGTGSDAERLTGFGRLLRATSLDELPQLWNVIRGDMSLVGPRPLLPEYLGRYSARHAHRHDVRPGITGWSAVQGRNALSWEEQFELDLWYIEHQSLLLDLRIVFLTIGRVLTSEGVKQPGQATRERFSGN